MSGPARVPRGNRLRASDADRDRAIDLLAGAAAEGRLTLEEYSERSGSALAARTQGELAALTADIPATPARGEAGSAPEQITAVLGNESRKGRWVVPARLAVRSVLGDCHLDPGDFLQLTGALWRAASGPEDRSQPMLGLILDGLSTRS